MHFLAIFLNLCVVVVILNMHVKDDFNWPSRISPRVMWICLSFRLNSVKTTILLFLGFLKIKNSRAKFRLIFENSLPKGFSCQSMKKSVISVLKINSRYLQSPGFKISSRFNHSQKLTANYALFNILFWWKTTSLSFTRVSGWTLYGIRSLLRACLQASRFLLNKVKDSPPLQAKWVAK